jgi:hypothetical protein
MRGFREFEGDLADLRQQLVHHPVLSGVRTMEELRLFMQSHVFAVWDFMSLLKTLQNRLTCTTTPWRPAADARIARVINEIVLGEESDEVAPGEIVSHFELYLRAMRDAGADSSSVMSFLDRVHAGKSLDDCFFGLDVSPFVPFFVKTTLNFCERPTHEVAAAFLYGREDVIPEMFLHLLSRLGLVKSPRFRSFRLYLERHIEVDGESHGPLARQALEALCGNSSSRWHEAAVVARQAMEARKLLWDGVLYQLQQQETASPVAVGGRRTGRA